MATIAQTKITGTNSLVPVTKTTMTSSDTFVYASGTGQILELNNTTAGSLTVVIDGAGSTTVQPAGLGKAIDVSGGFSIVLAAGAQVAIRLDAIAAYLSGVIAVTGGTGATAVLYS